jgi:hypothetical protein
MSNLKLIVGGKAKANPELRNITDDSLDDSLARAKERLGIQYDLLQEIEHLLEAARQNVPAAKRGAFLRTLNFVASKALSLDEDATDCVYLCCNILTDEFMKTNGKRD